MHSFRGCALQLKIFRWEVLWKTKAWEYGGKPKLLWIDTNDWDGIIVWFNIQYSTIVVIQGKQWKQKAGWQDIIFSDHSLSTPAIFYIHNPTSSSCCFVTWIRTYLNSSGQLQCMGVGEAVVKTWFGDGGRQYWLHWIRIMVSIIFGLYVEQDWTSLNSLNRMEANIAKASYHTILCLPWYRWYITKSVILFSMSGEPKAEAPDVAVKSSKYSGPSNRT